MQTPVGSLGPGAGFVAFRQTFVLGCQGTRVCDCFTGCRSGGPYPSQRGHHPRRSGTVLWTAAIPALARTGSGAAAGTITAAGGGVAGGCCRGCELVNASRFATVFQSSRSTFKSCTSSRRSARRCSASSRRARSSMVSPSGVVDRSAMAFLERVACASLKRCNSDGSIASDPLSSVVRTACHPGPPATGFPLRC